MHVYQPCVVLPELAGKMNSLVEVRPVALCTPATTRSRGQCVSDAVSSLCTLKLN